MWYDAYSLYCYVRYSYLLTLRDMCTVLTVVSEYAFWCLRHVLFWIFSKFIVSFSRLGCWRIGLIVAWLPDVRVPSTQIFKTLITEVCPNVAIEPTLQPLTGERLSHRTSNSGVKAHLDVWTQGFCGNKHWSTFFHIRVSCLCVQATRDPEMESLQTAHQRDWAWLFYASSVLKDWRNGACSHCSIQNAGLTPCQ